ncbi:hypothetical protein ACL1FI_11815 [Corynebacterium striatum]
MLADADGLDGVQLYALSDAIESYRDAVIEQVSIWGSWYRESA